MIDRHGEKKLKKKKLAKKKKVQPPKLPTEQGK